MAVNDFRDPAPSRPRGMWLLAAAVMAGLAVISLGYGLGYSFECRAELPVWFCRSLSLAVPRVLCAASLCGLILALRSDLRPALAAVVRPVPAGKGLRWLAAGFACILFPLAWLKLSGTLLPVPAMLAFWAAGLLSGGAGFLAATVDFSAGRSSLRAATVLPFALATGFGLILPDLALAIQPAWKLESVTRITFGGVVWMLEMLGQNVVSDVSGKLIWVDEFGVEVGAPCSGVEGFAIISAFTLFYLFLFRRQLNLRRAWLLLPVALFCSWLLNMVRITALILVGRYVSPQLAADGFHSQAGWLAFLALALAVALAAHSIPWLQKDPGARTRVKLGFFDDPAVAMILPFAVFMASASLFTAISAVPGLAYPWRAAMIAGVLALCWRPIRRLDWRLDALSLGTGLATGLLWIFTAPPATGGDSALAGALAGLSMPALLAWAAIRIAGTSVLVPVVEELFFRGYLQDRLALRDGTVWRWGAVAVSALLFGFLHDRMAAGTLAGLLFGALALRSGRVTDAIQSHAAANAVIAAAAVLSGAWHLI